MMTHPRWILAALLFATSAEASSITFHVELTPGPLPAAQSLILPGFDPALGTLHREVLIRAVTMFEGVMIFTNDQPDSQPAEAWMNFSGWLRSDVFDQFIYWGQPLGDDLWLEPGEVREVPFRKGALTRNHPDGDWYPSADFIGRDIPFTFSGEIYTSPYVDLLLTPELRDLRLVEGWVTVTYSYDDAAEIHSPEPGTLALLLMGLAVKPLLVRRRR